MHTYPLVTFWVIALYDTYNKDVRSGIMKKTAKKNGKRKGNEVKRTFDLSCTLMSNVDH